MLSLALLASWVSVSAQPAAPQTNAPPRPITITVQGGTVVIGGTNVVTAPGTVTLQPPGQPLDPLLNLMLSQPAIETQAPVMVEAEFEPAVVTVGARATYRLVLSALIDTIELPDSLPAPAGLELKPGARAQALHRHGASFQARSTFNFRASAAAPGRYLVPSFNLTVGGRPVSVPARTLEVLPAGAPAPVPPARLELELDRAELFVGQSLPARLVLTDPNIGTVQAMTQVQVEHDAFLSDPGYGRMRGEVGTRAGRPLTTFVSEILLTPIRAGAHTLIGQAQVIESPVRANRFPAIPSYSTLLDTEPITVTVSSVPAAGELPGFTGAIGRFEADPPQLSAAVVTAGDPLTVTLTLRGEGNFGRFLAPKPQSSRDWQLFAPRTVVANAGNQLQRQGFATFTYTLIPISPQVTATPPMPFCYFDPDTRRYVDLTIPSAPVKVTPAPAAVAGTQAPPVPAARAPAIDEATGERPLMLTGLAEQPGRRVASLRPLQQRPWFLALQLFPGLALLGLWLRDRRRRYLEQHPEAILRRQARREIGRQLRRLRRAGVAGDEIGFVTAAVDALRAARAPLDAANPRALVGRDVLEELPDDGTNGHDAELVRRLFEAADALHFAGRLPDGAAVLAQQGELERLLVRLRRRL